MDHFFEFHKNNAIYINHMCVTIGVFIVSCFFLSKKSQLYFSAFLLLANILAAIIPMLSNAITGEGITDATIYHVLYGREKFSILFEYDSINYILIFFLVFVIALLVICKLVTTERTRKISTTAQLTIIASLHGAFLINSPAVFEITQIYQSNTSDYKNYIDLDKILSENKPEYSQKHKKNLIVIYAESLEQSFFEENMFPGLTTNLTKLSKSGTVFNRIHQSPLSDWTIAGMVASQCGVPLYSFSPTSKFFKSTTNPNNFTCLADYLIKNDYAISYMGGADIEYSGKGDFYKSQGFEDISGLNELIKPNIPLSKWGLYDEYLLPMIEDKIEAYKKTNKPFAIFALTLDTHAPEGFPSPLCDNKKYIYNDGSNAHLNTIKCSDVMLANFLEKIISRNIDDTNIVLLSDHLMMNSLAANEILAKNINRFNRMTIWSKDIAPGLINRPGQVFDIASTIWHVQSDREIPIGFGRSLLGQSENLTETYGNNTVANSIKSRQMKSWKN